MLAYEQNEKEQIPALTNNFDEFNKHSTEQNKPRAQQYTEYCSLQLKFRNRQN